jgi:hypothetical protein
MCILHKHTHTHTRRSYNTLDTDNATRMEVQLTGTTQAPVVKNFYEDIDSPQSIKPRREKF